MNKNRNSWQMDSREVVSALLILGHLGLIIPYIEATKISGRSRRRLEKQQNWKNIDRI